MTKRKSYTRELKQDAVRLVTEQGYNQSEAARNLGIDRGMLGRWVKEAQEDKSEAFRGNGATDPGMATNKERETQPSPGRVRGLSR